MSIPNLPLQSKLEILQEKKRIFGCLTLQHLHLAAWV